MAPLSLTLYTVRVLFPLRSERFDTEDPRERDYVKTCIHRAYGKLMSHRPFIRRAMANTLFGFVFESGRHLGVAELLEVYGAIVSGFSMPLAVSRELRVERSDC